MKRRQTRVVECTFCGQEFGYTESECVIDEHGVARARCSHCGVSSAVSQSDEEEQATDDATL